MIEINGKVYRNIQEQVRENQKNYEECVTLVNQLESDVLDMQETVSQQSIDIEDAEDDIDRLKDRMDDTEQAIYDLETDVGNAQDDIDAIEANYVTTNTVQTISANKTFQNGISYKYTDNNINSLASEKLIINDNKLKVRFRFSSDDTTLDNSPDVTLTTTGLSGKQEIALKSDINYPVTDVQLTGGTSVVSNTVATIPGVYAHHISINGGSDAKTYLYLTLMTSFQTNFDIPSFIAYINSLAQLSANTTIACSGVVVYSVVGVTENCRAVAAIAPGTTSDNITVIYHGAGDAGIATIQYGPTAGANFQLTTLTDAVLKVL